MMPKKEYNLKSIDTNKKRKAKIIIGGLILCVSYAIATETPLYLAIAAVCLLAFLITSDKRSVLPEIIVNLRTIIKTVLLLGLISITLPLMMGSGSLPTFIVFFSNLMIGQNLLLSAFILSTLLSMLLGTSIGTLTILVPLFIGLAAQMQVPLPWLTGALISGSYFGDRVSPLASSLHLTSAVTETNYRQNIPVLLKSSVIPYALALLTYALIGQPYLIDSSMLSQNIIIKEYFNTHYYLLFPLLLMITLLILRVSINKVLFIVALLSAAILLHNGASLELMIEFILKGYHTTHPILGPMLKTNGMLGMLNVLLVLLFSACLNGILEANQLIDIIIEPFIKKATRPSSLIRNTALLSLVLSMITCSQAMTAMITGKYLRNKYDSMNVSRQLLVMSISNVGLNLVGLIPWNVNGLLIKQLTSVPTVDYAPYAFFLTFLSVFSLYIYPVWRPFKS
jgi:Na+:H+ antiporter, NhaC family